MAPLQGPRVAAVWPLPQGPPSRLETSCQGRLSFSRSLEPILQQRCARGVLGNLFLLLWIGLEKGSQLLKLGAVLWEKNASWAVAPRQRQWFQPRQAVSKALELRNIVSHNP